MRRKKERHTKGQEEESKMQLLYKEGSYREGMLAKERRCQKSATTSDSNGYTTGRGGTGSYGTINRDINNGTATTTSIQE